MTRRETCGEENRHATIGDVYKGKEATHDNQLMMRLPCLDEQFVRFDDWVEQFEEQIGAHKLEH